MDSLDRINRDRTGAKGFLDAAFECGAANCLRRMLARVSGGGCRHVGPVGAAGSFGDSRPTEGNSLR
jgi:hypothetical protein